MLYVGKARSLKKRVASYAKPTGHNSRIGRMIAATASMMFLTTETETEALLLEQNLIKQLKPRYNVLLRDDKSFPNMLVTADHRLPAGEEAPRAAQGAGALLRALRLGGQRQPDAEPAAEGVPAALLLGLDVREPDAALPALPDQALQRALRRADRRGRLRGAGRGRGALPAGQLDQGAGAARRGDGRGERGDGVRARRGAPRPHPGADRGAGEPGDQPRGRRGGRRRRAAPGGRPRLRAGLLHPRAPELGKPRLFPAHRVGRARRGRSSRPSSGSSTATRRRRG